MKPIYEQRKKMTLRITPNLAAKVEAAARANGRSTNHEIERVLASHYEGYRRF